MMGYLSSRRIDVTEQEKEFVDLVDKYVETFKENLPVYMMPRSFNYVAIIKKCLEEGKPYEPEWDKRMTY